MNNGPSLPLSSSRNRQLPLPKSMAAKIIQLPPDVPPDSFEDGPGYTALRSEMIVIGTHDNIGRRLTDVIFYHNQPPPTDLLVHDDLFLGCQLRILRASRIDAFDRQCFPLPFFGKGRVT